MMGRDRARQQAPDVLVHQPFRTLKQMHAKHQPAPVPVPVARPAVIPAAPPSDPASLFRQAVAGVTPLDAASRARVDVPAPASPTPACTRQVAKVAGPGGTQARAPD